MRRTKEDADKTREAILKAALTVFYTKGVSRSTLADIGKEAGVTRGAVYWHFKDKVDLFLQLHQHMMAGSDFRSDVWLPEKLTTLDDLRDAMLGRLQIFFDNPDVHKFIILIFSRMEYIEEFKEFWDHEQQHQRSCVRKIEAVVDALIAKGEIRSDITARHVARHIYAFLDGCYDAWSVDDQTFLVRDELEAVVDDFFVLFKPL